MVGSCLRWRLRRLEELTTSVSKSTSAASQMPENFKMESLENEAVSASQKMNVRSSEAPAKPFESS